MSAKQLFGRPMGQPIQELHRWAPTRPRRATTAFFRGGLPFHLLLGLLQDLLFDCWSRSLLLHPCVHCWPSGCRGGGKASLAPSCGPLRSSCGRGSISVHVSERRAGSSRQGAQGPSLRWTPWVFIRADPTVMVGFVLGRSSLSNSNGRGRCRPCLQGQRRSLWWRGWWRGRRRR